MAGELTPSSGDVALLGDILAGDAARRPGACTPTACPTCNGRATAERFTVLKEGLRHVRVVIRCWNRDRRGAEQCPPATFDLAPGHEIVLPPAPTVLAKRWFRQQTHLERKRFQSCAYCGVSFQPRDGNRQCCSRKCSVDLRRQRAAAEQAQAESDAVAVFGPGRRRKGA